MSSPDRRPAPPVPEIEWVFGCNTVLGSVAPRVRDVHFNGRRVPYRPWPQLGSGARWCSTAWLAHAEGHRGFLARTQSGLSRMGMWVAGQVDGGLVVVVPDDRLEDAVVLAESLLGTGRDDPTGLWEWSMALVRQPGRTCPAVRIVPPQERRGRSEVLRRFATEAEVEWFVEFGNRHVGVGPDWAKVLAPDGTTLAEPDGVVHLEDEPVPAAIVELARRYGDGIELAGPSASIHVRSDSFRPLEPDEWDLDAEAEGR